MWLVRHTRWLVRHTRWLAGHRKWFGKFEAHIGLWVGHKRVAHIGVERIVLGIERIEEGSFERVNTRRFVGGTGLQVGQSGLWVAHSLCSWF
jgi:hypothetical protein